MTERSARTPKIFRNALVASIFTLVCHIGLYLLPLVVPPPQPPGYAPYAFAYNFTYRFPLLALMILGLFAALLLLLNYAVTARRNGDTKRGRNTVFLLLPLLPPLAETAYFLSFFVRL